MEAFKDLAEDEKRRLFSLPTAASREATFLSDRVLVVCETGRESKEMVEIDLPRPRGEATRNDPKFTEYNTSI